MDDITTETGDDSNVPSNRGEPPTESTSGGQPAGDSETRRSATLPALGASDGAAPAGDRAGARAHRLERCRRRRRAPSDGSVPDELPEPMREGRGAGRGCRGTSARAETTDRRHPRPARAGGSPAGPGACSGGDESSDESRQDGARSGNRRRKRGGKRWRRRDPRGAKADKPSKDGQSKRDGSKNDPGRGDGDGQRKRRRGGRGRAKPTAASRS